MTDRTWLLGTRAGADAHTVHVATALASEKAPLTPQPWGGTGAHRSRWAGGATFRTVGAATIAVTLLLLSLAAARGNGVTPTNSWIDLYGLQATFAGVPIPAGSSVAASDPQGTLCGVVDDEVTVPGAYGIMPCYSDDPATGPDEGPLPGERLYFTINGVAATPQPVTRNGIAVPADTLVTWTQNRDLWQVNLMVSPRPPVTITLLTGQLRLDWQRTAPDITAYEIWRSTFPYFAPGDATAERLETFGAGPNTFTWSAPGGVGDPSANYTYRVRSMNALSHTAGISQAVAEFDYPLHR